MRRTFRALAGATLASSTAAAQDVPYATTTSWTAPAECPSAAEAYRELATPGPDLRARVVIVRLSPELLEATVSVSSPAGVSRQHVLRDPSCVALARAAALVVALAREERTPRGMPRKKVAAEGGASNVPAVSGDKDAAEGGVSNVRSNAVASGDDLALEDGASDVRSNAATSGDEVARSSAETAEVAPASVADETTTLAAPTPGSESELGPSPTAARTDHPEPDAAQATWNEQPTRLSVFAGASVGVSQGVLPGLAPGLAMHVGLGWGALLAALRFGYVPPQSTGAALPQGVTGQVALWHAAAEVGVRSSSSGVDLSMMAGAEPGLLLARAQGLPERELHFSDWLAVYASPGVSITWGERVRTFLRLDGLLALRRPRFVVEVADAAPLSFHRPERLRARVALGVEVVLP